MKTQQAVLYLAFVFKSKDGAAVSVQKPLLLLTDKCSECRNKKHPSPFPRELHY